MSPRIRRHACDGLTLVELIIVMIVIGILAAVSVTSIAAKNTYSVNTQADQMRRDLSHIQLLASSWGVALRFAASSTGYAVTCRSTNTGTPCTTLGGQPIDPATGNSFGVTFTDGVTMTFTCNTVDFDSMGRPISGTALITTNPACTYILSRNGRSVSVFLRPLGGFAETS
jgi:prepilin-type N-terminal cleavage/methylation domain-containing protein